MVLQEPVAVIGFDLMFPGDASTPEGFYELLQKGKTAHGEVPKDRYNIDAFHHPDPSRAGSTAVRTGHFLKDDIAAFDAPFFSFTAAEAACVEPQQRLLLETTYRALENSGISLHQVSGTDTSVFSGCFTHEYREIFLKDPEREDLKHALLGLTAPTLANRISWFFNVKGQSLAVETACSSSLVACHLAAQSLNNKESSMAIVTGCNLIHTPEMTNQMSALGVLSRDGKSYSFDKKANGYARGEGVAVVILKRISDAVRDGDTIRAVIRNIGCNQDGKSPGITVPTAEAQADLMNRLYTEAGLNPGSTGYFEAHATGTAVGDPIEMAAVSQVFAKHMSPEGPMYVGSVKTNIGHLEGAAGLAGLLKAIYILESGVIPKNLWFEKWNSQVKIDQDLFIVPTTALLWPTTGLRRVSLNSFGIGGTNAHVILDDADSYLKTHGLHASHATKTKPLLSISDPNGSLESLSDSNTSTKNHDSVEEAQGSECSPPSSISEHLLTKDLRLFLLSAFDKRGINRLASSYSNFLKQEWGRCNGSFLNDLSYTLANKRTTFQWRAAFVADSGRSLVSALEERELATRAISNPKLGLVFTGQGAQWSGMARELFVYPVFRTSIGDATEYLASLGCQWSLKELLSENSAKLDIDSPALSQPTVTAVQVALVELLESWSVAPHAVIGHSSGEIAAAFAVGAISRESAWRIAYHRGVLSATLNSGAMIAVGLGAGKAEEYMKKISDPNTARSLTVACVNSPKSVTISGDVEAIQVLSDLLTEDHIFSRKLRVTNAYHSPFMQPIADDYHRLIGRIIPRDIPDSLSRTKFFSSLLGKETSKEKLLDPSYWVRNLLSPVEFNNGLEAMIMAAKSEMKSKSVSIHHFIEVGPHSALKSPIRDILQSIPGTADVAYTSLLFKSRSAHQTILEAAGWLFSRGHQLAMAAINISPDLDACPPKMLVDLPAYQFDHSTTYWNESRLSKEYRFRKFPRHDLLGAPVPDWNRSNAVWGHWLRVKENPWIKDHVVTGNILYPGAGMLAMAIEASKQLTDPALMMTGFRFQDVSFHLALEVPVDGEGIETRFHLRPLWEGSSSQSATWNEFELWSYKNDEWRNHCRGRIQTEFLSAHTVVDSGNEQLQFELACSKVVEEADANCLDPLTFDQVYDAFDLVGLNYGPNFRNLSDVSVGLCNTAVMTLTSPNLQAIMPHGFTHPHIIHPTTLDGALSAAFIALISGGADGDAQAAVPTSVKELWIASDQGHHPLSAMRLAAKARDMGARKFEASMTGVDLRTRKPLLTIVGMVCTAVTHGTPGTKTSPCFNVDWRPDATLLRQEHALRAMNVPESLLVNNEAAVRADIHLLIFAYLKRYIRVHGMGSADQSKTHYRKYLSWAQRAIDRETNDTSKSNELALNDRAISMLEAKLENANAGGKLTVSVGRALPEILQGKVDPLQLLFTDQLAENIYHRPYSAAIIASYMRALAHKNPHMNILEVGAGTGATTGPVLQALEEGGKVLFSRYDFTDLSPAFFEHAEEKFQGAIEHRLHFNTLNIEEDPVAQNFEAEKYDVIIASNVVHATGSISNTLKNIRRLLKPGGKLILFEVTNLDTYGNFSFGLLPGWWLSTEKYRQEGPLLTVESWAVHLQESGFDGVDLCFDDGLAPAEFNVMISSAQVEKIEEETNEDIEADRMAISIIIDDRCPGQHALAKRLQQTLVSTTEAVDIVALSRQHENDLKGRICIFLPELYESVLSQPNEDTFDALKQMCRSSRACFWVVQGGGTTPTNPAADMVLGFARTMRMENAARFVTLSLQEPLTEMTGEDISNKCELISRLLMETIIGIGQGPVTDDNAFSEKKGVVFIPRLVVGSGLCSNDSKENTSNAQNSILTPTIFGASPERAFMLDVATPGMLDSMRFIDDPTVLNPPGDGEVEFRILASGQNFRHLLHALGQLPNSSQGSEAAGIVTRVGSGTPFKVGDRVFGCHQRVLGTYARGPHQIIAPMPAQLSFHAAAAIPIVFSTAYMALYDYARIQPGETVLIHAAAGGLGQASIQLAQIAGAEIFATVGSEAKCQLLMTTYGIPRDHIFSSRDLTFAKGVMRMTKGRGVDVVVNSLSGAALLATWACVAPFGRFAEAGKKDVLAAASLPMSQFIKNVSFRLIDLELLVFERPEEAGRLLREVMQLVASGDLESIHPLHVFPYSRVQEAYQFMQTGAHSGKIVLEPQPEDVIMALPSQTASWVFDAKATYVISGGLGGIGRGIARWMVKRGARNLVLLSRTGAIRKSGQALLAELESKAVTAFAPAADVTDTAALAKVFAHVSANMPPIKGCIQAAMVLKPALFENMTISEYKTCIDPKLSGSVNLQKLLPKTMDFFIMLSSFAGLIGEPGEANYAAGNTYQDAFARHLVSQGQKAIAIDLGMMGSIGYVAESLDRASQLEHIGLVAMRPTELYSIFDQVCNPALPVPSAMEAQAVFGVPTFQDPQVLDGRTPLWKRDPIFIHLRPTDDGSALPNVDVGGNASENYRRLLGASETVDEAVEIVTQALAQKIWKMLKVEVQTDVSAPLHTYGVDSLVAIELRSWLLNEMGAEVTIFDLIGSGGLDALAPLIVKRSTFVKLT
ncbi:hypothetical protein VTL71DRAFT_9171 [Oculimacula yallundae]|uniref:Polyketide synthase n=1 Tax=Oculimacula yallundae TaxID=86028 RepID=A0ABR4BS96_9HELO